MIAATCADFFNRESSDPSTYEEALRDMKKLYSDLESCYWVDEGNGTYVMRATTEMMMTESKRMLYIYLPRLPGERSI